MIRWPEGKGEQTRQEGRKIDSYEGKRGGSADSIINGGVEKVYTGGATTSEGRGPCASKAGREARQGRDAKRSEGRQENKRLMHIVR